jgi:hypothetical protein
LAHDQADWPAAAAGLPDAADALLDLLHRLQDAVGLVVRREVWPGHDIVVHGPVWVNDDGATVFMALTADTALQDPPPTAARRIG